jgi:sec-independent protein translocase protein TatA
MWLNSMLSFIKNLGPTELIILAFLLILLFGAKKVVDLGRGAGEATKELKKVKKEFTGAIEDLKSDESAKPENDSGEEVQK